MIQLDDLSDSRLGDYRLLAQPDALRRRGLFVAEGRLVLPRLLDALRFRTHSMLLTMPAWEALRVRIEGSGCPAPVYVVPQDSMNDLVGFDIHRGCLALVQRPTIPSLAEVNLASCRRLVVLEGVNNPDNVGGLFRNAAAFSVDLVVLGPHCGDPFYRKAIRTSMGATLGVPIADAGAWPQAIHHLREHGVYVMALTPSAAATPLAATRIAHRQIALLLGAEGDGLSPGALEAADARVRIQTSAAVDSLNVATAAAIALHHVMANGHGSP